MTHILFAGIGGIGGYFGGQMAHHYTSATDVKISFLARGEHARIMREQGLLLQTTKGEFRVQPALVTDNPAEIGQADFVLIATKSYDLAAMLAQLAPCIGPETVLIPLLNGVEHRATIAALRPETEVWNGCVYTIARLVGPGVVRESGGPGLIFFGAPDANTPKTALLQQLMADAGIRANVPADSVRTIWEKFFMISPLATLTSYLDKSVGAILADPRYTAQLQALFDELLAVAAAEGVDLPADIAAATLAKMAKFPYDSTSSMHSDYQRGSRTELASLTGAVVAVAHLHGLPVPTYEQMYAALQRRIL